MQTDVNTHEQIKGSEVLRGDVEATIERSLARFRNHFKKVETHLREEDEAKKRQNNKRCMIKARLEELQ